MVCETLLEIKKNLMFTLFNFIITFRSDSGEAKRNIADNQCSSATSKRQADTETEEVENEESETEEAENEESETEEVENEESETEEVENEEAETEEAENEPSQKKAKTDKSP
jgi:hypothetical protein